MKLGRSMFGDDRASRGRDYGLSGTSDEHWLDRIPAAMKRAEDDGYDFVTANETNHDSMLAMAVAASHSQNIGLQTSVTIAFPRPPMILAMEAWEIQHLSKGRLAIGLGSQVRAHNERRFSAAWTGPAATRMREYVRCMHAIWETFQTGAKPEFMGKFYQFTLMTPHFTPGPINYPRPKILLAAVGEAMARAAGEVADGIIPHGFMTDKYMREVVLKNVKIGLDRSGRTWEDFDISGGGFTAFGGTQAEVEENMERLRQPIAYYGSTPAYQDVWRLHGWDDLGQQLHTLSRQQKWEEMRSLITDDVLETFAQTSTYEGLPKFVAEKREYASRFNVNLPMGTPAERELAEHVMKEIRAVKRRPPVSEAS